MSIKREMTGSPWHVERVARGEDDAKRHKSRCIYYDKDDKSCAKIINHCVGSAHCKYYLEDDDATVLNRRYNGKSYSAEYGKSASEIKIGTKVNHKKYGNGEIKRVSGNNVTVSFESGKEAKLDIVFCMKNKLISLL